MKPAVYEALHCATGIHCARCRSDRGFRAQHVRHFGETEVDFLCPPGVEPKPIVVTVTRSLPLQPVDPGYVPTPDNATRGRCCS